MAAFTVIRVLGGAYVIYLGIRTFRQRRALMGTLREVKAPPGPSVLPAERVHGRRDRSQDRPRRAELLGGVSGVAMIGVGVNFLLTRRRP